MKALVVIIWLAYLALATVIGDRRSYGLVGFLLGLLLGPLGGLVAVFLPRTRRAEARHRLRVERELAKLRAEMHEQLPGETDRDEREFRRWRDAQ